MKIEDIEKVKNIIKEIEKVNARISMIDIIKQSIKIRTYGVTYKDPRPLVEMNIDGLDLRISVDKAIDLIQDARNKVEKEKEELIKELENV